MHQRENNWFSSHLSQHVTQYCGCLALPLSAVITSIQWVYRVYYGWSDIGPLLQLNFVSIVVKYLISYYSTHTIFTVFSFLIATSQFICSLNPDPLNLTITIFISCFCVISCNILCFSLTVNLFRNHNPDFWVVIVWRRRC